jgi:hypothetical protein
MKSVNVEEYLKREITQEEHDEIMTDIRRIGEEIRLAELEDPLPDDFIEYVKGRKTKLVEADLVRMGIVKATA